MPAPRGFDPRVGDSLTLFGENFAMQSHPAAPAIRYAAEGSRATVYQMANTENGGLYALKVFNHRFLDPSLIEVQKRLAPLKDIPGLSAARRRVVLPSEPAAMQYPALQYAMLMPWIQGKTWFDLLDAGREENKSLPLDAAVQLCEQFLGILRELERRGAAHTDIAPGNVVVDVINARVELLDLEEIYLPGSPPPSVTIIGSAGYRHRAAAASGGCWCEEGDRYAGAVLAAEILVLSNPAVARLATDQGYFGETCDSDLGRQRYAEAEPWLRTVAPEFLEAFRRSWNAPSLPECPPLWTLHNALLKRRAAPMARAAVVAQEPRLPRRDERAMPTPLPEAKAPIPRIEPHFPAVAWVAAVVTLMALLAGLYVNSGGFLGDLAVPAPQGGIESPPVAGVKPASLESFQTTFVGSREIQPGVRETLVLEIREIAAPAGKGSFIYTLNAGGVRTDNEGTVSLAEERIDLPDLGAGRLFLDREGRPSLSGLDSSPAGSWMLQGVP